MASLNVKPGPRRDVKDSNLGAAVPSWGTIFVNSISPTEFPLRRLRALDVATTSPAKLKATPVTNDCSSSAAIDSQPPGASMFHVVKLLSFSSAPALRNDPSGLIEILDSEPASLAEHVV